MKKLVLTLSAAALMASALAADAAIGQKVYSQVFKPKCEISGTKFAASHTQDEWQELLDSGEFANEMKTLCNDNIETVPQKFVPHLFDFAYKYANDSGNVPSC